MPKSKIPRIVYAGLLGSVVVEGLLLFRHVHVGDVFYGLLIWNIFLAWLAWLFGVLFLKADARSNSRPLKWGLFLLWLGFLPNTFYILTDFIHPIFHYGQVDGYVTSQYSASPDAYIVLLDIIVIGMSTWIGWLFGIASLRDMYRRFSQKWSTATAVLLSNIIIVLSSYAVFLGRIPRWNSWDLVRYPHHLFDETFDVLQHPIDHADVYAFTILMSIAIGVVFWGVVLWFPPDVKRKDAKK